MQSYLRENMILTRNAKARSSVAHPLLFAIILLLLITAGCHSVDPASGFIAKMDQAPIDQLPKNWEETKSLMARRAPLVGEAAPDFTLSTLDGTNRITRTEHQGDRPQVLIFGSFT